MTTTQNYPSPTHGPSGGDRGPFYHHQQESQLSPPPQEVPDDLQLRADLARSLGGPFATSHEEQASDRELGEPSPQQYDGNLGDPHDQLAQSVLGLHEASPVDLLGAQARQKDQRQKVSRACDECRRKKVHQRVAYLVLIRD